MMDFEPMRVCEVEVLGISFVEEEPDSLGFAFGFLIKDISQFGLELLGVADPFWMQMQ